MTAPLKVTVTDANTGEKLGEQIVVPGDFVVIAHEPCYIDGVQAYPLKGTQVLTIKGHKPQKSGERS